jgi:hypothetical protein
MFWIDDDAPLTLLDVAPLFPLWFVIGAVVLVACDLHLFWDEIDRRFIAHFSRMPRPWLVYVATLVAVLVWPVMPFVMAKPRAVRRAVRGRCDGT